jgi:hypothetical protein
MKPSAPAPATAQIIKLPRGKFDFEAYDLQPNEMSERIDRDRVMVVIIEGILRMNAQTLKRQVELLPTVLQGRSVGDLISDLKSASDGFDGLAKLFECAAARLTVIDAKLI